MVENSDTKIYFLLPRNIYFIVIYYILLFIIGIACFGIVIYSEHIKEIIPSNAIVLAMIGCSGTSLLGSVIYYLRKIYLICIHNNLETSDLVKGLRKFGTIIYFCVRPIFSVIVCIVIILGLSAGVFAFFISDGTLSPAFVDFCMVITFFLGISNGKLIDSLDKVGKGFINKIFDV